MNAVIAGHETTFVIPVSGLNGEFSDATAVSYRVVDGFGNELLPFTPILPFESGSFEVTITVSAAINTLSEGSSREVRLIEALITTERGTIKTEIDYVIEAMDVLVVGQNSFLTYAGALQVGYNIPAINSWQESEKSDRITALISAHKTISQMVFNDPESEELAEAKKRAQVLEADYLLGGDEVGEYRRAGLMSMTVGEAKQFFRPGKVVDTPICRRAMKELNKWLVRSVRIARRGD